MSQLGKMLKDNLNLRQNVRNVRNPNRKLTPRQLFAQTYGLQTNYVKSVVNEPAEKSNFLNAAYSYCRAGIDNSFKQELHYISNGKFNL